MTTTSIEWTDKTWNPVAGCNVLSAGCTNCYAMTMAARLSAMKVQKYIGTTRKSGDRAVWTGKITLDHKTLDIPHRWRKPAKIFVNSMSDLFHDDVPLDFIERVFEVIRDTPRHRYQVLTKRADRLLELAPKLAWPDNLWMGVSVENADVVWRIDRLRDTPAKVKFLSCEPLLGSLGNIDLVGIDWVIAGGESGAKFRPMEGAWVREIRDRCQATGTPFHFKQWSGFQVKKLGRELDGRTWDEWPAAA